MKTWKFIEENIEDTQFERTFQEEVTFLTVFVGLVPVIPGIAFVSTGDVNALWFMFASLILFLFILGIALREHKRARIYKKFIAQLVKVMTEEVLERYTVTAAGFTIPGFSYWYEDMSRETLDPASCRVRLTDNTTHKYGLIFNDHHELQLVDLHTPTPDAESLRTPASTTLEKD